MPLRLLNGASGDAVGRPVARREAKICELGLPPLTTSHTSMAGSDHVVAINNVAQIMNAMFNGGGPNKYAPIPAASVMTNNIAANKPFIYWNTTTGAPRSREQACTSVNRVFVNTPLVGVFAEFDRHN